MSNIPQKRNLENPFHDIAFLQFWGKNSLINPALPLLHHARDQHHDNSALPQLQHAGIQQILPALPQLQNVGSQFTTPCFNL